MVPLYAGVGCSEGSMAAGGIAAAQAIAFTTLAADSDLASRRADGQGHDNRDARLHSIAMHGAGRVAHAYGPRCARSIKFLPCTADAMTTVFLSVYSDGGSRESARNCLGRSTVVVLAEAVASTLGFHVGGGLAI
jgi:hypothetical protein